METTELDITTKKGDTKVLEYVFKYAMTILGVVLVWLVSDMRSDIKDMKTSNADLKTRLTLVEYILKMDQKLDKLNGTKTNGGSNEDVPYYVSVPLSKPENDYEVKDNVQEYNNQH